MLPLEAVPNVSEGRDAAVIEAVAAAFSAGVSLLDVHSDPDHHRTVLTLAGTDDALVDALVAGVARTLELVDLRRHDGVHPCIGAADVVPVVPLVPGDLARAAAAARRVAERVGAELGVPVFLYGAAGGGRRPAFFRRGGQAGLQERVDAGELAPDFGPGRLHPRSGAVLVGARPPLVAFNVELATDDLEVARAVAAVVREAGGGFPGVRALGLALPRRGGVQVSMNVEDWRAAPLHEVVAAIEREAAALGVQAGAAELVGLLPVGVALQAAAGPLRLGSLPAERTLELRVLEALSSGGV